MKSHPHSSVTEVLLIAFAGLALFSVPATAQQDSSFDKILLGELSSGDKVYAVQPAPEDGWGIWVMNKEGFRAAVQPKPMKLQYYQDETRITDLEGAYRSVTGTSDGFSCTGAISPVQGLEFVFEDTWTVEGKNLKMTRKVTVNGRGDGGFATGISLALRKDFVFPDIKLFAPGMSYGTPDYLSSWAPAGSENYQAGKFNVREEDFTIPLCGIWYNDSTSVALFSPSPKGNTTAAETADRHTTQIDKRFLFGMLGANNVPDEGIALSYVFPGNDPSRRRYHPAENGCTQEYRISFRFSREESYRDFYTSTWRWAWKVMNPSLVTYNIDVVQRSLVDHLAGLVYKYEDRIGIPFWTSMVTGKNFGDGGLRDRDAIMGFVGKDLEGAAMLIRESYEDKTERGKKYYQLGTGIIGSMIKYVKVSPPSGEGFNIDTGEPSLTNSKPNHVPCCNGRMYLRAFTDDMRWLLTAYQWELARGREHYDWWRWCVQFAEWLLKQQKPDGSFPRSWYPGTDQIYDDNYQSTYNAMAFLVKVSDVTGDDFWTAHGGKYPFLRAAEKAGDFAWETYQKNEQYVGGTIDNNNVQDKEAGTLSLEGYLALYENTKDRKWLDRAQAAGNYAETYIYGWNVPMPDDQADETLQWKKDASTVGVSKISTQGSGVDQWMAGDVDEYARLYKYSGDPHYKEIAALLLHNTKNMVALPGRLWDLYEPGAQQEHWMISFHRGQARHRGALPWVTVNHITGIFGLRDFDLELYKEIAGSGKSK
jgi:hypothetical protein